MIKSNYDLSRNFPENSVLLKRNRIPEAKSYREVSIYHHDINLIERLSKVYIFKSPNEIKRFLIANRDLIPILLGGREQVTRIFGNVPVYLELHSDPEEGWEELFMVIKTNYPAEKAFELENRLFNEWFMPVMDEVGGRLNFTEEPL